MGLVGLKIADLTSSYNKYNNREENPKENKDMNDFGMGDMGKMFKGMFGPIEAGKCKLGMNGKIAIKTPNGYKTYDAKKNRLFCAC